VSDQVNFRLIGFSLKNNAFTSRNCKCSEMQQRVAEFLQTHLAMEYTGGGFSGDGLTYE